MCRSRVVCGSRSVYHTSMCRTRGSIKAKPVGSQALECSGHSFAFQNQQTRCDLSPVSHGRQFVSLQYSPKTSPSRSLQPLLALTRTMPRGYMHHRQSFLQTMGAPQMVDSARFPLPIPRIRHCSQRARMNGLDAQRLLFQSTTWAVAMSSSTYLRRILSFALMMLLLVKKWQDLESIIWVIGV